MKKFKSLLLLAFLPLITFSQGEQSFSTGERMVNFGLGFSSRGVPIYGNYEVAITPDITVGGQLSFSYYSEKVSGYTYHNTDFTIVGFGNYHFNDLFNIPSQWDTYAGLNLGYSFRGTSTNIPGDKNDVYSYPDSGLYLGIQVGGRYFWNDLWAINLELGGGSAFGGKIGVTYRLN